MSLSGRSKRYSNVSTGWGLSTPQDTARMGPGVLERDVCRIVFFFFQAEDGIRDVAVTGVQTCALPISRAGGRRRASPFRGRAPYPAFPRTRPRTGRRAPIRSEFARAGPAPPASAGPEQRERESGGEGKRGDLGGRRVIKKKKKRRKRWK